MGRPRRQESRRAHLIAATQRVLARDGLVGLRVREVATEAGMSPASVLYYFPDSSQLAAQALEHVLHAAGTERSATAASIPDPFERLLALINLDIPDPLPGIRRALCEIPGRLEDHPELARLMACVVREQVAVYRSALEDALAASQRGGGPDVGLLARCLVADLIGTDLYRFCGLETAAEARHRVLTTVEGLVGGDLAVSGAFRGSGAPGRGTTPARVSATRS
jgi:AcrR family transcriptional regulator